MKFTVWASILFFAALAIVMVTASGCGSSSSTNLTDLNISPISPTITVGETIQFSATAVYSNNTNSNVTSACNWTSGNTNVATITSGGSTPGLASGVGNGSVSITCSFASNNSSISSSTTMQVNPAGSVAHPMQGSATVSFQLASGTSVSGLKIDGHTYETGSLPSQLSAGRHFFTSLDGHHIFVMNLYGQRAYDFSISSNGQVELTAAREVN
ncbi:MAG TPA: Ig-like domain-containing protein [Terriglobales bacterium]